MDSDSSDNELRGLQTGGGKSDKGDNAKVPAVLHTPTRNLHDHSAITRTPKARAMQEDSEDEAPRPAKRAKKNLEDTPTKKKIAPGPKPVRPKLKVDDRKTGQSKNAPKKKTGTAVKKAGSAPEPQEKSVSSQKKSSTAGKRSKDQSAPTAPATKKAPTKDKKSPARGVKKSKLKNTKVIVSESDDSDESVESEDDSSEESSDSSDYSKKLSSSNNDEESSSSEEEGEEESEEESEEDEESNIQSHDTSAKVSPREQPMTPKDKGGRPSAEKKVELEVAVFEISAVIAKCAQRLNMAHDRMLDAVLDQDNRGPNAWNIYQCYVVDNFDQEILRLPEHDRVDQQSLTPELVGRLFSLFKDHCTAVQENPREFLLKWRRNIEILEGNCSFRARTESFQSWFARVQRIMKEGAENWSFDSLFLACGRIVNQDQSLCELAYAGLAEDFFSKQLDVRESLIQGHFRTHVFSEESRSSAVHIKKKILAAKLLPSEQSEGAEDPAKEDEIVQEESNTQAKQQQSDEKLRESLNNLLKKLNLKPSQTWKALPKYLALKRYTIINWPRVVPLPFESRVSRKGIVGLGVDARKAWYAGLTSAANCLSLQPWSETATAADTPVIQLAPEGPKKPPVLVFEDTSVVLNGVVVGCDADNQWTPLGATCSSTPPLEKGKKRPSVDDPTNDRDGPSPDEPGPKKRAKTADLAARARPVIDKTPANNPEVPSSTPIVRPPSQAADEDNPTVAKPKNKAIKDDVAAVVHKKKANKDEAVALALKKKANKDSRDADKAKKAKSKSSSKKDRDHGRKQEAIRSNQTSDAEVEEEEKESEANREHGNRMGHSRDARHVKMRAQESHGEVTGFKDADIVHHHFPQEGRARDENIRGEVPPFSQRREGQTSFYETAQQRSDSGRSGNLFFPPVQAFPDSCARSSTTPSESGFSVTSESSGHHQRHSSLAPSEDEYPPRHRYRQQESRSRNISPGLTGYSFNNNAHIPSVSTGYNSPWRGPYDSQAQHPSRQHQYARQDHFHAPLVGPGMNVASEMGNLGNGLGTGMGPGMNITNSMGNLGNGLGTGMGPGMNVVNSIGNLGNSVGAGMGQVGMNMMTGSHDGGSSNNHFRADNTFDNPLGMADQQGLREQHLPYRVHDDVFG